MGMSIDKAGHDYPASCIDNLFCLRQRDITSPGLNLLNPVIFYAYETIFYDIKIGIDRYYRAVVYNNIKTHESLQMRAQNQLSTAQRLFRLTFFGDTKSKVLSQEVCFEQCKPMSYVCQWQ